MNDMDEGVNNGPSGLGLVAAACVLALGLGAGGYFLAHAAAEALDRARAPSVLAVKGLAEKSVRADLALWPLRFLATGNDLATTQTKLASDARQVVEFFKQQGLEDAAIVPGRVDVVDRLANEYGGDVKVQENRYIVYANVMVRSAAVDRVQAASRRISDLVKTGVVFTAQGPSDGERASLSPWYLFTRLNDVKLEMLTEATRNARAAADQLARDSGRLVRGLLRANQGVFSILPGDGYPGAVEEAQPDKTVRVVMTADYALAE